MNHIFYSLYALTPLQSAMDLASSQISISNFPGDFSDPVDLDDEAIKKLEGLVGSLKALHTEMAMDHSRKDLAPKEIATSAHSRSRHILNEFGY